MEITIYAKTKKTAEGRTFKIYLSRITRKSTGEEVPVRVNFAEGVPLPTLFPVNILVDKKDANLSKKTYKDADGVEHITYNLWVNDYQPGAPFEDHSLDDFE